MQKILFNLGLLSIIFGILCNQWILGKLFAHDGTISTPRSITIIWAFEILLIITGSLLIGYKKIIDKLNLHIIAKSIHIIVKSIRLKLKNIFSKDNISLFCQSHSKLLAVLTGFIISILILLCIEGIFFGINHFSKKAVSEELIFITNNTKSNSFVMEDDLLGYKPTPNTVYQSIKKINGKTIYNVKYSIDEYGRRITPSQPNSKRDNYVLFFGCSVVFGEGLNDNETLPYYFSEFAPKYKPYNYAVPGYGTQQMLARFQGSNIRNEVSESTGKMIYVFPYYHVKRVIGSMSVYNNWAHLCPYYYLDGSGNLVRNGNFTSGRPLLSYLYSTLWRSQILQHFNIDIPSKVSDRDIKLTYEIIRESYNNFRNKFKSDEFYVVIYCSDNINGKIIPLLKQGGIKYLDYSSFQFHINGYDIEGDGHPSAKANKVIAEKLVKDLGLKDTD